MKYLWMIVLLLCISCQTAQKYDQEQVSEQISAFEEELKALVSFELANKDYRKKETSLKMWEYRRDMYLYIRKQSKKKKLQVGPPLSQRPTEQEFRSAESYLLDAIHQWKQKRSN